MEYYAHIDKNDKKQTVKEHLENTGKLARDFSVDMFKDITEAVGKCHDMGKYTAEFQKRLAGSNIKFEHSICGAQWINENYGKNLFSPLMEFCIAGHHSGLPDGGTRTDDSGYPTLFARLGRKTGDYSAFFSEMQIEMPDTTNLVDEINKAGSLNDGLEIYAFMTKYVFSCLTDADFLDTEKFCSPNAERGISGNFNVALEKINNKLATFEQDTKVRKARKNLLDQAVENIDNMQNINILNMPTGSGKTLCSMKIALEKVIRENKKRIIYVIPYTSIIEQTAEVFSDIFGKDLFVLQHHSNYDYSSKKQQKNEAVCKDDYEETAKKLKKTCENWDAPLIVTTSVQFFQSLYHYKGSRLRKLHNLADSIIVFDEIHLLPIKLLQPCLRGIGYITKYLNSKAIFLSATMPDYTSLISRFLPDCSVFNMIDDKSHFADFENCTYTNLGKTEYENIVEKSQHYLSSLIIVNSRKNAQYVYGLLSGKKFHLSTYMTPVHRSKVILQIRECLDNKESVTVVSTSLVEAGVDLDFEAVFRECAGLDSILQSGGRCNREGRRDHGYVFVFETSDKPKGDILTRANIAKSLFTEYENINTKDCIEDYYGRLFKDGDSAINKNSIACFEGRTYRKPTAIPFRSYAENFEFIESDTVSIVIDNCDEVHKLLTSLRYGELSVKRSLQRYSVSVYYYEFEDLLQMGIVTSDDSGIFLLANNDYYNNETGLTKCFPNHIV